MRSELKHNPRMFVRPLIFASFLCALCVLWGKSSAQDFKTVHEGVEYVQVEHKLGSDPVKINLLRLDLTKVRLDVHHAMDAAIGTEKTSSLATRRGAVAAINAGFFRLDTSIFAGESAGVLRVDRRFFSESDKNYPAVAFINDLGETKIAIVGLLQQRTIRVGGKDFFVGTNRERKENEIVQYTPDFGLSTLTNPHGTEIVVRSGQIRAISESTGSSAIPSDGFVISASGDFATLIKRYVKIGGEVELDYWTVLDDMRPSVVFESAEDIVGGRGHLLRDAKIILDFRETNKSFVETRHPRTAVAKMKDGKFLMMTVDGRQPGVSVGMSLQELAEYLLSLGAVDAMNLDGGGSTTMFLDGKVVNTPSDKEGERKVGDAILVTLRKKPATKNKK